MGGGGRRRGRRRPGWWWAAAGLRDSGFRGCRGPPVLEDSAAAAARRRRRFVRRRWARGCDSTPGRAGRDGRWAAAGGRRPAAGGSGKLAGGVGWVPTTMLTVTASLRIHDVGPLRQSLHYLFVVSFRTLLNGRSNLSTIVISLRLSNEIRGTPMVEKKSC